MLNSVALEGRLGADPEMRYTANGVALVTFRLAVPKAGAPGSGDVGVDWFAVVAWAELAEEVASGITKGDQVRLEGKLQTRSWQAPDGSQRSVVEVVAKSVVSVQRQTARAG